MKNEELGMKCLTILALVFPLLVSGQQSVELGDVHWLRSFREAQTKSAQENKPILILFQEIPGCATCRNYGSQVLTHPLLVEAIETEFIPLAIHNNKGGADAEVLKRYGEPSWNNPVVRIVEQNGDDIVSRLSGNYSAAGLARMMSVALIKSEGSTPDYLNLLANELDAMQNGTQDAVYSMFCFWTGEALFGKLNGVVRTTAGFQSGHEVVSVTFDPAVITKAGLDKIALSQRCNISLGGSFRPDATPKYYLSNSPYQTIPMTETQKCRVNSALGEHQSPDQFLSPRQLAFLKSNKRVNCVELSLVEGWKKVKM